jgi:hypothetical protein
MNTLKQRREFVEIQFLVRLAVAATAVIIVVFAAGCGPLGASTVEPINTYLPQMEALAGGCSGPLDLYAAQDLSATGLGSPALLEARARELKHLVLQVAACGGYVQAVGFSASSADTAPLGEASFPTKGSEDETARLIAVHASAQRVVASVRQHLPAVMRAVGPRGTDVLAQLQLASQFAEQHQGRLIVQVATDGIASTGPVFMESPRFTTLDAEAEARQVSVPTLPGATVRFIGIGRTSAPGRSQLSTARVAALLSFYTIVCHRTGAAHCVVVTDYAEGAEQ